MHVPKLSVNLFCHKRPIIVYCYIFAPIIHTKYNAMKKIITAVLVSLVLLTIGSCTKNTCTDASAPNYAASAPCTDLTSGLTGTYSGTFQDSLVGSPSTLTGSQTVVVTRIDDSHIQFTPSNSQFFPFTASISSAGYLLTISSGTYQGLPYTGASLVTVAGTANGAYSQSNRQIATAININNGGVIETEYFLGSH